MRYKLTLCRTVYQIAEVHVDAENEAAAQAKHPTPDDEEWQVSEYLETDVISVEEDPFPL